MSGKQIVISYGNKLPLASDVVRSIVNISPTPNSEKQSKVITVAIESIHKNWEKVFPAEYLMNGSTIRSRIKKLTYDYHTKVVNTKCPQGKEKSLFFTPLDYLFDALAPGVKIEDEALIDFLEDQKGPRMMCIRNEHIVYDDNIDGSPDIEDKIYYYLYLGKLIALLHYHKPNV
jgi:hypothetical protein